jgi:hypothetical protein
MWLCLKLENDSTEILKISLISILTNTIKAQKENLKTISEKVICINEISGNEAWRYWALNPYFGDNERQNLVSTVGFF